MQKIVLLAVATALLAACSDSAKPPPKADGPAETWVVEDKPLPKPRPKQPGQF